MSEFKGIRHVVKAASQSGYDVPGRREILEGELFTKADAGLLAMLKESFKDRKKRERLFTMLEMRTGKPVPLAQIIRVFDRFSILKQKLSSSLTAEDIKFINFSVEYFQEWFFRGEWVHLPKRKDDIDEEYTYFAVPAGILNLLTKLKEASEYKDQIKSVDSIQLREMKDFVRIFTRRLLDDVTLQPILEGEDVSETEKIQARVIMQNRDDLIRTFTLSEKSVFDELTRGHPAADLYFMKTCMVAAEILRRQRRERPGNNFLPDITPLTSPASFYKLFDFSNGRNPLLNSMHYPTMRLPYCVFVVEYFHHKS